VNSQETGFFRRAKRKIFWRRDPERVVRGGRRPVNLERRAAGRERLDVSPMANPERTGRLTASTMCIRRKAKAQSLPRMAGIRREALMWTEKHAQQATAWFRVSRLRLQTRAFRKTRC
jgi:hypothetical protein